MKNILLIVLFSFSIQIKAEKEQKIKIKTKFGIMIAKLYNKTPKHRDNFIKLVKSGKYNGVLFHRVIKDFMIQSGDINSKNAVKGQFLGNGDLGYTISAEFNYDLFHKKGALAAARQSDNINPQKASSSCQFYIVDGKVLGHKQLNTIAKSYKKHFTQEQIKAYTTIGGTPHLDGDYTVFGEVIKGLDIIDKIAKNKCDKNNRPLDDIKITIELLK